MQYDNVYKYEIYYLDKQGDKKICYIYGDSDDVYSLKNLPETTFFIFVVKFVQSAVGTVNKGTYLVGTPLKLKDLKEEIKIAKRSKDEKYLKNLNEAYEDITYMNKSYAIFRKQGKLLCLYRGQYSGEIVGDIENGKIVKEKLQAEQGQSIDNKYNNDNYTDLE